MLLTSELLDCLGDGAANARAGAPAEASVRRVKERLSRRAGVLGARELAAVDVRRGPKFDEVGVPHSAVAGADPHTKVRIAGLACVAPQRAIPNLAAAPSLGDRLLELAGLALWSGRPDRLG